MKLKSIMGEGFLREEFTSPSFLPKELPGRSNESPCNVAGNSSWSEDEGVSNKSFSFISRQPMHSFCEYIFDLEQQHGVHVALSYKADDNTVDLKVPHQLLGGNHFRHFFQEIDNIYYDVVESFKK
ncbi:MAG: hypothetical protein CMB77_03960 [Euryarchaeota archaeon]|nr:hypothetical protein [Euryarchaeota archaeon]|tara:strand:+ start:27640 stop:28017 length:378 start_codon:yes stop_codon:yes gene_type:complete